MAEDGVCVLSWGWNPPVAAWKSERSVPPGVGPVRAPQRGAEGGAGALPRGGPAPGTALRRQRRARALARGVRPGQQGAPEWREGNCRSASGRFPARSRYLPRGRALAPLSPPQSPSARPLPAGSWSGAAQRQPTRPRPAGPPRLGAGVRRCRGPAQAPGWARGPASLRRCASPRYRAARVGGAQNPLAADGTLVPSLRGDLKERFRPQSRLPRCRSRGGAARDRRAPAGGESGGVCSSSSETELRKTALFKLFCCVKWCCCIPGKVFYFFLALCFHRLLLLCLWPSSPFLSFSTMLCLPGSGFCPESWEWIAGEKYPFKRSSRGAFYDCWSGF